MMTFVFVKISNMVFLKCGEDVWKAWDEEKFTERKMKNAMKKIQDDFKNPVTFEIRL